MSTSSAGTISSTGIGSGLDVKSIVSQLVAIEKAPLTQLQTKATSYQTQLSTYGTIKSQVSTLYDAAALLSGPSGWNAQAASSSNAAAVGVTASSSASASSLSVEVSQLARAQTSASVAVSASSKVGAVGDLTIDLGSWSSGVFKSSGSTASVAIVATDTMSSIATKINAKNAGVTATVLSDGAKERLVFKSSTTGIEAGFRLNSGAVAGLSSLGLTNPDIAQTASSGTVSGGAAAGANGTLKIELGGWSSSGAFNANGSTASVVIGATDTMQQIATKINAQNAGVTATVSNDGTNDHLVFKSSTTGSAAGFRLNSPADAGLASLGLTNPVDTAQTSVSSKVLTGQAYGTAGSLKIDLGSWSSGNFAATGSTASVDIAATDTMQQIATKINAQNAGVTATVSNDGTNDRLVFKSSTTGSAAGFRLNSPADAGLTSLGLTNPSDTGFLGQTGFVGQASFVDQAAFVGQDARDAKLKINGVDVTSGTNKMANAVPGVTLQLSQVTTAPVDITVAPDLTVVQKNIQSFVDAYNAFNSTIADATAYNAATKTGGPLLGDSTTLGLQMTFRSILGSASTGSTDYKYLSDIGIERQTDGSLKINQTKLTSAQGNLASMKALFATNNSDAKTNGFGIKVRDYAHGLINFEGLVTAKTAAFQRSIASNNKDQDRVTLRASKVEAQLLAQYSALDTKIAGLNGLNSYVTAQLAVWNKPSA